MTKKCLEETEAYFTKDEVYLLALDIWVAKDRLKINGSSSDIYKVKRGILNDIQYESIPDELIREATLLVESWNQKNRNIGAVIS